MTTESFNPSILPEDPVQNLNYLSFLKDSETGAFIPGVFVAYKDGEFVGLSDHRDTLIEALGKQKGLVFLTQVGAEEEILEISTPFFEKGI